MLKVHVLFEHSADLRPHGCSHIRLLAPLAHPANAAGLRVTQGTEYTGGAEVVMVERTWRASSLTPDLAEKLAEAVRRDGARLIYTLDDNLLDLRPASFVQPELKPERKHAIRRLARRADGVIVSTESLRDRMRRLNPNIVVVPNALDERLFTPVAPDSTPVAKPRLVIGFMGTYSHDADLLMILQALRAVLRRHADQVELQVVGGVSDTTIFQTFAGLPCRVLNDNRPDVYPDFVPWMVKNLHWDLALAPLEASPFNQYKSDIKFLDYGALGFPALYSRVPIYENIVRHLETGYLVDNTVEDWEAALEKLLGDEALRRRLAQNAHEYVWNNRMLAQCAPQWQHAIMSLVR